MGAVKKQYKTMVVRVDEIGELCILCFTDGGQPAVYEDAETAELHAIHLRFAHPGYQFKTLDFLVL